MKHLQVYQVALSGASRKIGPEGGFQIAGLAHGYAMTAAASTANNRYLYQVVGNDEILAVYPGSGILTVVAALEDPFSADDDEESFAEAA